MSLAQIFVFICFVQFLLVAGGAMGGWYDDTDGFKQAVKDTLVLDLWISIIGLIVVFVLYCGPRIWDWLGGIG